MVTVGCKTGFYCWCCNDGGISYLEAFVGQFFVQLNPEAWLIWRRESTPAKLIIVRLRLPFWKGVWGRGVEWSFCRKFGVVWCRGILMR